MSWSMAGDTIALTKLLPPNSLSQQSPGAIATTTIVTRRRQPPPSSAKAASSTPPPRLVIAQAYKNWSLMPRNRQPSATYAVAHLHTRGGRTTTTVAPWLHRRRRRHRHHHHKLARPEEREKETGEGEETTKESTSEDKSPTTNPSNAFRFFLCCGNSFPFPPISHVVFHSPVPIRTRQATPCRSRQRVLSTPPRGIGEGRMTKPENPVLMGVIGAPHGVIDQRHSVRQGLTSDFGSGEWVGIFSGTG